MTAIVITQTAREQIDAVHAWWLENRPAAPSLFADELAAALALLAESSRAGGPYAHPRATGVRRVLLFRCRYHLYYTIEPAADGTGEVVIVVALWQTQRGSGPPLR